MHVRFVPSIILLNKAALVEQYYLVIHEDASSRNEGILEEYHGLTREPVEEKVVGVEGLHFCPELAVLVD